MNLLEDDFLSSYLSSFFSPLPEVPLPKDSFFPAEMALPLSLSNKRERSPEIIQQNLNVESSSASKKSRMSDDSEESETTATTAQTTVVQRRLWVKARSRDWWDRMDSPTCPESEFRREFRMSRATFDLLCDELGPSISKEDTTLRAAIPVRHRVAVCIYRLATGEPLRLVSKRFGLGISTCHKLVLEVCSAIKTVLMPKYLNWPADTTSDQFEEISGIPNVVGSIYTTHIPIIAPKANVGEYFNRRHTERNQKTSYSVTVQGVVDPNGVFTDICIGWPGSMSDEQVLAKSALFQRGVQGHLDGKWVVGGSEFPLMDWLLVPYGHTNLTWTQHAFNNKCGDLRALARRAFARMKGRWGCLQKRTEMKLQDLPVVLGACCVLHNICELRKEEIGRPEAEFELVDDEMVAESAVGSSSMVQVRDTIAHNLLHSGRAGFSFSM